MSEFERLSREEYLEQEPVNALVDYLSGLLSGKELSHGYKVLWKLWCSRLSTLEGKRGANQVAFCSLEDALGKYFWVTRGESAEGDDDAEPGEPAEFSYEANALILEGLTTNIRRALDAGNEDETFLRAMEILEWGGVWKGAAGWLIKHHRERQLVARIQSATTILSGSTHQGLERFNDADLRLDSGLTKVFSLASGGRSIIYDDRVAAALGLLVGKCAGLSPRAPEAPAELRLVYGSHKRRNLNAIYPDAGFESKQRERGGRSMARWNLRANWILGKAFERHQRDNPGDLTWGNVRDIEAALFMIGYSING